MIRGAGGGQKGPAILADTDCIYISFCTAPKLQSSALLADKPLAVWQNQHWFPPASQQPHYIEASDICITAKM